MTQARILVVEDDNGLREDRFVVAEEPQFALVRGLKIIG